MAEIIATSRDLCRLCQDDQRLPEALGGCGISRADLTRLSEVLCSTTNAAFGPLVTRSCSMHDREQIAFTSVEGRRMRSLALLQATLFFHSSFSATHVNIWFASAHGTAILPRDPKRLRELFYVLWQPGSFCRDQHLGPKDARARRLPAWSSARYLHFSVP